MSESFSPTMGPLVLIVDDTPEERRVLARYLTRDCQPPHRLHEASGISEALDRAAAELPDCVLLDFNLIGGTGIELLRQLVATYGLHAFGLIMLTGSGDTAVAVEAMKAGAHDYVDKDGLTPTALRRAVANSIEKACIQRQLGEQRAQLAIKNDELANRVMQLQHEMEKRAQAESATHLAALQMRAVTDHLPINIAQFDREYRYRFANLYFTSRFGLTPESIVGKTVAEVVGQDVFETYRGKMAEAQSGQHVHFETAVGDKWMSVTYVPERNEAGEAVGFIAVSADISGRRQSEIQIGEARDEAVAATKARDNFLATLSHELRTPLNPVLLIASEAAENASLPKDVREDFMAIRNHVELEARLIDDLLDLSSISHGKLTLQRRDLSLHGVLRNALAIVNPYFAEKKIRLGVDLAPTDALLDADAVRMQQIFWNVLKNAVKFTPMGGAVTVETQMDVSRRLAIVKISDTGMGLSESELTKVFEAFSQGDHASQGGSHRFGGLGLGLSITRMLVEAHGGRIKVESAGVDQGATFTMEFPIEKTMSMTETAAPLPSPDINVNRMPLPNGAGVERKRLLLVEDHASTRSSLTLLLERRGFFVKAAGTVGEAIAFGGQVQFDLVISDIGLPDGDGFACMQSLRKLQPAVLGIALSGYGMEDDRARSKEAGFVEHLIKPVNIQALDQAIVRTLNRDIQRSSRPTNL